MGSCVLVEIGELRDTGACDTEIEAAGNFYRVEEDLSTSCFERCCERARILRRSTCIDAKRLKALLLREEIIA